MAGASLLALIDDIATILDDVSILTKVAAKKTSGVLGDDLALNAQQVSGVDASREIPVVLAVAKGSFINKVILVPIALLLSVFLPALILPLLLIGGLFLCFEGFEGFEKVFEKFFKIIGKKLPEEVAPEENVSEADKIKGAIRTDFILSAEIIVISLGTVAAESIQKQAAVLSAISVIMTVGVYGLVAGIVKLDDLGFHLIKCTQNYKKLIGKYILLAAPLLMKFLGLAGTIAMFLVGGSLIVHAVPVLHHSQQELPAWSNAIFDGACGFISGGIALAIVDLIKFLKIKFSK